MNYLRGIVLSLALNGSSSLLAEPPALAPVYRITGVVISSLGEAPIPHAHLSATAVTQSRGGARFPSSGNTTDADEHGRFNLTVPSSGAWHLTASAPGFATQALDQHDLYSSAVVLTASEPTINLRFRLPPESEITGTVLDEAGEAVRNARVTLQSRPALSPDSKSPLFQSRMTAMTDDRGVYSFGDLSAGDYRILVDAKPWYSLATQPRRFPLSFNDLPPDSSLDVTYQLTWFPGVDDPEQAEILSLRPGENRRADFHLVPIPAVHLQFPSPVQTEGGRNTPAFPFLERIDATGNAPGGFGQTVGRGGQIDVGGLAPGLYRMRLQGQDRNSQASIIEISPGSSRIVDVSAVSAPVANILISVDDKEEDRSAGVELRNVETGRRFSSFESNSFVQAGLRRNPLERKPEVPQQMNIQVPPGKYEVQLTGRRNTYLMRMTAKGGEVSGRLLTVNAGDVVLTLHTATGFASISGIVNVDGRPVVGAMVLLVPAGLGDPNSLNFFLRDQTNTDGSFDINSILPGPYILVAIDHGWDINWKDPSTLARYLVQGIPLDLHPNATLKRDIPVQMP